jgi:hypothetical protein
VVWNVVWSPDSRSLAYLTNPTWTADDANLTDIGVVSSQAACRARSARSAVTSLVAGLEVAGVVATRHRDVFIEKDELWVCPATGAARPCR